MKIEQNEYHQQTSPGRTFVRAYPERIRPIQAWAIWPIILSDVPLGTTLMDSSGWWPIANWIVVMRFSPYYNNIETFWLSKATLVFESWAGVIV